MSKKTSVDFQNCLIQYEEALLKLIPAYYHHGDSINSLIGSKKINDHIKSLKANLRSCKPEKKPELAKQISSLQVESKQTKKWEKVCEVFVKDMQNILKQIDNLEQKYTIASFRFKFFSNLEYNENVGNDMLKGYYENVERNLLKGTIKDMAIQILLCFEYYLAYLMRKKLEELEARKIVIEKMRDQKKEFLREYKDELKISSGSKVKEKKDEKEKKDTFNDVILTMLVDWKGSYLHSLYKVSVNCNNPLDEFKLAFRFMPVFLLLVNGVKKNVLWVTIEELKKAYRDPDEAKKEIVQAFKRVIGQRAKRIIDIERGVGKKLIIPKKNIKLTIRGNNPFKLKE